MTNRFSTYARSLNNLSRRFAVIVVLLFFVFRFSVFEYMSIIEANITPVTLDLSTPEEIEKTAALEDYLKSRLP